MTAMIRKYAQMADISAERTQKEGRQIYAFLDEFFISFLIFQAEVLEGECHEHSTTSKINLIDLAGSEHQSAAKTSGERLKVCIVWPRRLTWN